MNHYEVSYSKNSVYQAMIVITDKDPEYIKKWMKENRAESIITGIRLIMPESIKPSISILTI